MPEGPECTIVAENLNAYCKDRTLSSVEFLSGRYSRNPVANIDKILDANIIGVSNKGKFIYWIFDNGYYLFSTLGMSGIYSKIQETHSRVKFTLDKNLDLYYNDVRNFGTLKVADQDELDKKLKEIGPDMLNDPCSYDEFERILNKYPNRIIAPFLLDQKRLSGIGNIYKAESCYLAGINPSRNLSSLSRDEKTRLYRSIIEILTLAYECKGSSQKDYKDLDGELGNFLQDHAQVYRRTVDKHYGNPVTNQFADGATDLGDGRTTWWCPNVQK